MRLSSPSLALCFSGLVAASGCSLIASPDESLLNGTGGESATSSGSTSTSSGASTTTTSSSSPEASSSGSDGGGGTTSQGGGGSNQGGGGAGQGGQGGGGGPVCVDPETDCPDPAGECEIAICDGDVCATAFVEDGEPTTLGQTSGDCQIIVCDGEGGSESIDDDTDDGDVDTDCVIDRCVDGVLEDPPELVDDGEPCGSLGSDLECLDGVCVGCVVPADCGADTPCHQFTCSLAGECGDADVANDTLVDDGIDENCESVRCDGSGNGVAENDDADPEDDDNDCTDDACEDGDPTHDPLDPGDVCDLAGGLPGDGVCDGTDDDDACVECLGNDDCGANNLCEQNTCDVGTNTCDAQVLVGTGIEVADPTDQDCRHTECDGLGNAILDDPEAAGTACNISGGSSCDATGNCISGFCDDNLDCDGFDTVCTDVSCNLGTNQCTTVVNINEGGLAAADSPTDCNDLRCVSGTPTLQPDNGETPPDDGNECTNQSCVNGTPTATPRTDLACAGGFCTSGAACVECTQDANCVSDDCDEGTNTCNVGAAPTVTSTVPGAGDTDEDPLGTISVTFSAAMNPATITGKTDATTTTCTGSVQLSEDDFATCIAIDLSMTAGNTVAQLDPAPAMSYGRPYKIRVTTGAQSALGAPLASTFTLATAFTTEVDDVSEVGGGRQIVISQVYTGSGDAIPTYDRDFVELHNRGTTAFSLAGMSIQYAAAGSSTWSVQTLSGSIPAGGYLLVALAAGGAGGAALPTPDVDGTIAMDTAAGKVALKVNATPFNMNCPTGNGIIDLVGYGTAPGCVEGSAAPAPSNTTALLRGGAGCADNDQNATDFTALTPAARNASMAAFSCVVRVLNESSIAREIDACTIENAVTVTGAAGSTVSVSALVDEASLTNAAGAGFGLSVQIGVGPRDTNPETEAGWAYTATSFLSQSGTADRWGLAAFTLPAAGTYGYTFRVSQDGGVSWTYCDGNGAGTGANDFEITRVPTLNSN